MSFSRRNSLHCGFQIDDKLIQLVLWVGQSSPISIYKLFSLFDMFLNNLYRPNLIHYYNVRLHILISLQFKAIRIFVLCAYYLHRQPFWWSPSIPNVKIFIPWLHKRSNFRFAMAERKVQNYRWNYNDRGLQNSVTASTDFRSIWSHKLCIRCIRHKSMRLHAGEYVVYY